MNEPTHLDLFSGIGGFALAASWAGFRTVAFAEYDDEAAIMLAAHFPGVPNLHDVRQVGLHSALGRIDLLTGGVPCQPASMLGKRLGSADERWLWPDTIRIVRELRPRFCVFENPPALLSLESGRAFAGILGSLAALGYDVLWGIIPAACVGAGHLRERVCIIAADADNEQWRTRAGWKDRSETDNEGGEAFADSTRQQESRQPDDDALRKRGVELRFSESPYSGEEKLPSNSHDQGPQGHSRHGEGRGNWSSPTRPVAACDLRGRVNGSDWWHEANTRVPVLAHGIPAKLAEAAARCTGNAIVPQAFYPILKAIRGMIQ